MNQRTKSVVTLLLVVAVAAGVFILAKHFQPAPPAAHETARQEPPVPKEGARPPAAEKPPQSEEQPAAPTAEQAAPPAKPAPTKRPDRSRRLASETKASLPQPSPPVQAASFSPLECVAGELDAPVKMEVFSDHQCPACRRFYLEVTRPVLADYAMKGKVCVVYHEFPLNMHQHARRAARYTQAAGRLGQTEWIQVTDALYLNQARWAADGKLDPVVARALSAEQMAKVRKWVEDPKLDAVIDREIARGRQAGVRSTPTIFITANGKTERIPGGVSYSILRRYLDSLLARAQ